MGVFVVDIKPIFLVFLISCQNDAKSTVISYIAIEAVTHLSFEFLKQNTSAAPLLLTFRSSNCQLHFFVYLVFFFIDLTGKMCDDADAHFFINDTT